MDSIQRKYPIGINEAIGEFIRSMKLASGINTAVIYSTWDKISGAAEYTVSHYFKDGTLYVKINSSVVRNELFMRREMLVRQINIRLAEDPYFIKDDPSCMAVTKLVLQ